MAPSRNIWSVTLDQDVDALNQLLGDGVGVDERSDIGETPLHLAARHGLEVIAKALLDAGANMKLRDWESGWTPLHRSLYFGHVRLSLLLVQAGALIDGGRDQLASVPSSGNRKVRSRSRSESIESASAKGSVRSSLVGRWSDCLADHDGNTPLDLLSLELRPQLMEARMKARGGDVYSFGKADFFLGFDSFGKADVVTPRRVEALANLQVVHVAASRYHSAAVTLSGKLFTWGHGRGGRLGHGNEDVCMLPTMVEALAHKEVTQVAASDTHTAAVTADGELFTWGRDRFGQLGHGSGSNGRLTPKRVEGLRKTRVANVAAGTEHTAVVSEAGTCYTWGRNNHGQLGYDGLSQSNVPRAVAYLSSGVSRGGGAGGTGRHVLKVSASARSTVVVTRGLDRGPGLPIVNEVYQWGHGSHTPSRVNFNAVNEGGSSHRWQTHDSRVNVTEVAAAKYHNVALSSVGQVFSWGFGADNLGLDPREAKTTRGPKLVAAMLPENCGGNAVHVSASDQHTCVVTDTGDLFTWGTAGEGGGALGHGNRSWQPVAKRVPNLKKVALVAAAADHTLVLLQASCPPLPYGAPLVAPEEGVRDSGLRMERVTTADSDSSSEDEEDLDPGLDGVSEEKQGEGAREPVQDESGVGDVPGDSASSGVLTLKQHCEIVLARLVDLRNASSMLAYADALDAPALTKYCARFLNDNLDGVLVLARESDRECLLETAGTRATSMLGTNERKVRRAPSLGDLRGSIDESPTPGVLDEEEGLDHEAMANALARAEVRAETPSAHVTARAVRSLKKKLVRIAELEGMRNRGEELTDDQMRRLEDKARMETELGALGAQLERAKLIQTARARRMQVGREEAAAAAASVPRGTEAPVVQRTLVFDAESSREGDSSRGHGDQAKSALTPELDLSQTRAEAKGKQRIKCEACGVTCADSNMYADHLRGKRHRTQMARLEKQLHDKAGASQPPSQQTQASAPATVMPASPPAESMGAIQSKGASAPEDTADEREPCRNTKYSGGASNQGTMRTSLEQQHAATQVRPWGAWNETPLAATKQAQVPMSLLGPKKSLSSPGLVQQSPEPPRRTDSVPTLHSLTDFIVAPGSAKSSRRKNSAQREAPVKNRCAWATTEDQSCTEDSDAAQGAIPDASAIGAAVASAGTRAGAGPSTKSRKSFSEIIAEEEREKKEREEYGGSVWFVSRKPRSTSFETIVQQQRREEEVAEMEKAQKMQDELEEEMLRLALEMSKAQSQPRPAGSRSGRAQGKGAGGSGGGRQRSSAGDGHASHQKGTRRRRDTAPDGASASTEAKGSANEHRKERTGRGSGAKGKKKAATDARSGSGGSRTNAVQPSREVAGAGAGTSAGGGPRRHSRSFHNGPRCGTSLARTGGQVEEMDLGTAAP